MVDVAFTEGDRSVWFVKMVDVLCLGSECVVFVVFSDVGGDGNEVLS